MEDAQGAETNENTGAGDASGAATVETPMAAIDPAEFAKLQAENAKLLDENAKRRVKAREKEKAHQAELMEQGQFKGLSESLQTENDQLRAELEELKARAPDADKWASHVANEEARIAEQVKSLPAEDQEFINSLPSVDLKAKALARVTTAKPAEPATAAANGTPVTDFRGLKGAAFAEAIKNNPDAFRNQVQADNGTGGSFRKFLGRRKR